MKNATLVALVLSLAVTAHAAPPTNDDFGSREDLGSPAIFNVSSANSEATLEVGEPDLEGSWAVLFGINGRLPAPGG